MTQRDAISEALNDVLGPVMARPERMEEALAGRKDLCDRLADAALAAIARATHPSHGSTLEGEER